MKTTLSNRRGLALMSLALLLLSCAVGAKDPQTATASAEAVQAPAPSKVFFEMTSTGELKRPRDYRTWVYVGTPVTPNELNGGKAPFPEFHNVYIDPVSYAEWKETGRFRENTILVKELVSVGSKQAVSGKGYFMGDFLGVEATIKSAQYFPDEPGNWAYFSFTDQDGGPPHKTAKAFEAVSCNACHQSSAADDFVFTQYYPVLRAAKASGSENPENASAAADKAGDAPVDPTWAPTAPTPAKVASDVPTGRSELFTFLREKKYESFPAKETARHSGRGPHTRTGLPVRVFMGPKLAGSLAAGAAEHPLGSSVVKEMYDEEDHLQGWAVMVKTQAQSDSGRGWLWYEVTSAEDPTAVAAYGNGVPGCYSCHSRGGDDLVLSGWPLD